MLTLHEEVAQELATDDRPVDLSVDEARACGMPAGRYERVAVQVVSEHRWYTKRLVVFRYAPENAEFEAPLGFHYLDPASEMQEDQDRFEADPVPTFAVVGRDVVTTVYEKGPAA